MNNKTRKRVWTLCFFASITACCEASDLAYYWLQRTRSHSCLQFSSVDRVLGHLDSQLQKFSLNASVDLCFAACHVNRTYVYCKKSSTCYSPGIVAAIKLRIEIARQYIAHAIRMSTLSIDSFSFVLDVTDATRPHREFFKSLNLPVFAQAVSRADDMVIPIPDVHMMAAHSVIANSAEPHTSVHNFGRGELIYIYIYIYM